MTPTNNLLACDDSFVDLDEDDEKLDGDSDDEANSDEELVAVKKTLTFQTFETEADQGCVRQGSGAAKQQRHSVQQVRARRVLRECRILGPLRHVNIIRVVDMFTTGKTTEDTHTSRDPEAGDAPASGSDGKRHKKLGEHVARPQKTWLVLELMHDDLEHLIDSNRSAGTPFTSEQARCLMQQLLSAVDYLHGHGIMHRDIKPANCLLSRSGVLKLSDFGTAKMVSGGHPLQSSDGDENNRPEGQSAAEQRRPRHTREISTPWYRAPELIFGQADYDTSVDIWSVGCTFGELLRGSPLFTGTTELEMVAQITQLLGPANESNWPGVTKLPYYVASGDLLAGSATGLEQIGSATDYPLLKSMLTFDPANRVSARQALDDPYFLEPIASSESLPIPLKGIRHRTPNNSTKPRFLTRVPATTTAPPRSTLIKKLF